MELHALETVALLAQARQGDQEAFGLLCQTCKPRLLRQGLLLCGDVSLAEDLAQETLIQAWRCLHRYNGRCQFVTWLCAILHNRYRAAARRKRFLFFFGLLGCDSAETRSMCERQTHEQASPDQAVEARERAALVRRCVQALPAKQQQVIYLRFFVDDSLEGIAAALHCSVGTVKSRLFHALERLRAMRQLHQELDDLKSNAADL